MSITMIDRPNYDELAHLIEQKLALLEQLIDDYDLSSDSFYNSLSIIAVNVF